MTNLLKDLIDNNPRIGRIIDLINDIDEVCDMAGITAEDREGRLADRELQKLYIYLWKKYANTKPHAGRDTNNQLVFMDEMGRGIEHHLLAYEEARQGAEKT